MTEVVCAIIKNTNEEYLIAKRLSGKHKGKWEFVGGKLENNESHEQALKREVYEELGIKIEVGNFFVSVSQKESNLILHAYFAEMRSGLIHLNVHEEIKWVPASKILDYNLLEADIKIVKELYIT